MSQINSVHETPVFLASKGHHRLALTHPHTTPVAIATVEPRSVKRSRVRESVKRRRSEVARGAGYLMTLATEGERPPHATPTTGFGRQW